MCATEVDLEAKYVSAERFAQIIDASVMHVYRLIKAGELPGTVKFGKLWRINLDMALQAGLDAAAEGAANAGDEIGRASNK